jgi:hypothetical protein
VINYAPTYRPKNLVTATKGDQMAGTFKVLRVFKRPGEFSFIVAIDNCYQGDYVEMSDAMERFNALKESCNFA